jgi:putative DNA primase/helicase
MTLNDDAKKRAAKGLADKYILHDGTDPDAPGAEKIIQLQREQEPMSEEEAQAEIARLAALPKLDYEQQRLRFKRRTGYRLETIDALVDEARAKLPPPPDVSDDRPTALEPVVGTELVADLIADLTTYIKIDPEYAAAAAFWVIHTYLLHNGDHLRITPRLAVTAPEKQCGKTTFIDWLGTVVQRPKRSDNITAAAVYHVVELRQPTLLIDEADTYLGTNNELRGILNSGHRSDGTVDRSTRTGGLISFSTYSACAIALIGDLPATLQDRSIRIRLRRRLPGEKVSSLRGDRADDKLARRCARWELDKDPAIPPELFNRVEDNWRPLLAIADLIGGEWPERLREIAVRIAQLEVGQDPSTGERLLEDIRDIIDGREWITSEALVSRLEMREWSLTKKRLASLLKPYGISPRLERHGEPQRGYLAQDFQDAFSRYLSVTDVTDVTDAVAPGEEKTVSFPDHAEPSVTNVTNVTPRFKRRFT